MHRLEEKIPDLKKLTQPGRTYKIIPPGFLKPLKSKESIKPEPLRLFTLGCADGGVEATRKVAELMSRIASGELFDLIIILGDNFSSKDPATHRAHSAFLTHLQNIFAAHPTLRKIPTFVILGNHDVIDNDGIFRPDMMEAQILHTYTKLNYDPKTYELSYAKDKITQEAEYDFAKIALFYPKTEDPYEEIVIHYEHLLIFDNMWFMFARHFSILWGDDIEIIAANTNTLAKEFLHYVEAGTDKSPLNQITFLLHRTNVSTAKTLMCAAHHPIVHTNDKRTVHSDHPDYVNEEDCKKLIEKGLIKDHTTNHTDILGNIFFHPGNTTLGIPKGPGHRINVFIVAHHHAQDFYKNGNKIQIKAGGAGGPPPLQNRFSFDKPQFLPTFMKNNGVVTIKITPAPQPQLDVDLYGIADPKIQLTGVDPHVRFSLELNSSSLEEVFQGVDRTTSFPPKVSKLVEEYALTEPVSRTQHEDVEMVKQSVIKACKEYQIYLSVNPPPRPWQAPSWVPKIGGKIYDSQNDDVVFVDALLNYFNSCEVLTLEDSVLYLHRICLKLKPVHFPEWAKIFNGVLNELFAITYENFISSTSPLSTKTFPLPSAFGESKDPVSEGSSKLSLFTWFSRSTSTEKLERASLTGSPLPSSAPRMIPKRAGSPFVPYPKPTFKKYDSSEGSSSDEEKLEKKKSQKPGSFTNVLFSPKAAGGLSSCLQESYDPSKRDTKTSCSPY